LDATNLLSEALGIFFFELNFILVQEGNNVN